uniref:Cell adhesion molecule L1-like b n=1 Tax=Astatotilapia calliptera TaxID=8154 RepID=A0AAX7T880_ASTCA
WRVMTLCYLSPFSNDFCMWLYFIVEQPPTIITYTSGPIIVLHFDTAITVKCKARGNPPPEYRWEKDGQAFVPPNFQTIRANQTKGLLVLHSEDMSKFEGKYRCYASNKLGTAMTNEIEIKAFKFCISMSSLFCIPKFPKETLSPIVVTEGEPITLKCNPPEGVAPRLIYWMTVDLQHIEQNERVSMGTDGNLYFSNALKNDSRQDYGCFAAFNRIRTIVQKNAMALSFILSEQPLEIDNKASRIPSLLLPSGVQTEKVLLKGEDLQLECIPEGFPTPSVKWIKMGEVMSPRVKFNNYNKLLSLSAVEESDEGKYMCTAENSAGKAVHYFDVIVEEPPKWLTEPPQSQLTVIGSDVHIKCSVSGKPQPAITWRRNGVMFRALVEGPLLERWIEITYSDKSSLMFRYSVKGAMLEIMNVNLSDQGTYTCTARTSLDEDSATAVLTVRDVPDAPIKLDLSELDSPRNVVLSWIPGSDHNSTVTEFVVEYEENRWEPGRWKELQRVTGNQATAELKLYGNLNYQFRVYAVNAIGPGPPSEPTERHKTPPAAPDRNPENIKIQGHHPHQMEISWEPLSPVERNGPGFEYKVKYRQLGVEDSFTEHMVNRSVFLVNNTPTFVPYEIKILSRNSYGWGPEPKPVTGYSGEDVPTAAPRDIAVEVINTTVLRVSWTPVPPATVRGRLGGYNVHWVRRRSLLNPDKILDLSHSMSFSGNRSHVIVPGLEPFSEYKLTVYVFNKKGNGPKSDPVTFNTPEGVPEQVTVLTSSIIQRDSVRLEWAQPPKSNGILTSYLLQYHLINETALEVIDSKEINITGADTNHWTLQGLKGDSLYRFDLRACTRAGCGPPQAEESRTDFPEPGDGNWRISEAVNASQSFHIIDGLEPGTVYTVRLMAKRLLDNASIFEDVIETRTKGERSAASQESSFSTHGWMIGTMCAVALLTLVVVIACFLRKNKGGKYAVKEKEEPHSDTESQKMNDDTFCDYSDSDEKPLKGGSLCSLKGDDATGDSVSRYTLGDYADGGREFNEDGSFIGEYSGHRHRGSVSEPNGPSLVNV